MDAIAIEAREIVRRAVGDAAGLTIKAQLRQAARHLGYPVEDWRVREAFYGRAGSWSAAALDDLRRRHAAWREAGRSTSETLARRLAAVRDTLAALARQIDELETDVGRD